MIYKDLISQNINYLIFTDFMCNYLFIFLGIVPQCAKILGNEFVIKYVSKRTMFF
jgi:hypothetical protein